MAGAPLSYCASLVRTHDYDRYLCTLFAPASVREAWFALFAFNHEIASVAEIVSEEMIGFIRFAWWREALDEIYGGGPVRKHPVAQALAEVIRSCQLPRAPFEAMIDAREAAFGEKESEPKLAEGYFKATSSGLLALCAQAAGLEASPGVEDLGIVWASVGMARVFHASGQADAELLQAATGKLSRITELPSAFRSFRTATEFYLKRLEADKPTGREARFYLTAALCWRRVMGKI